MTLHRQQNPTAPTTTGLAETPTAAGRALAALRLLMGFLFLWAFFDKVFGWGYATTSERAWINGGSPTQGYLGQVKVGPLESTFHSWAGTAWADWLFMLGLLAIGTALVAGVALRLAAASGTLMMALMWVAEWPPARELSDGTPSMSVNPLVEYHVIYAAVLVVLALTAAGGVWGLGRAWARLPLVARTPWLR
ncbi:DoxX family membrane protein [Streptomyces sp. 549]|uniref:DoxX family membrane protein n=1 Tax=Streptomyces sp. 549 TaxID=3049076 RepID=UPI0024C370EA|nr:DoxX family membrane protein [Streptomyces sp. 549]MDK1472231.1 DoxX family membrane protein [Streptomyces sp. 549]